ncbi:toll/interleukin-1 receptor domain-containing protein [Nostoc sp. CMAA1605]|uniref:toll/interleukin-1 receptor domain-containing protein n=1 Tax=Nostoc sp. CMAA1605 TaxID=2055159 RepID=UPI001F271E10|nr:toll/interleukin-1 receptor domain-containing protein [Nostoc sp. CMAA1605]MCF4967724.1 hypothetical protein [Nostoc sp. CMAA1605]
MKSIEVFISYHEKDEEFRQELEKHLASLRRQEVISSWHDRKIIPGQDIKGEIDQRLNQAGLILLLISPDFLDSDYHWTVEVTRALEQNAAKKTCVIPVLLRHVDWDVPRLKELLPLPKNRKPIKSWADRDEAFVEVVKGIREAIALLMAQLVENESTHQATTKAQEDLQYQVTTLINEADSLREGKNFEEAILKYKAAISLEPNSLYAHNGLGITLYNQGKLEEAIASYRQALNIDPNFAKAHNGLGNTLYDQGKLEKAIASYRQALKFDPSYAKAYYNLGNTLYDQGKVEEAIASYRQVLNIDPNYAKAHNNLGLALYAQKKLEEAIASYRQALKFDSNDVYAHCNLGIALSDQGKVEEAIASYRQALNIDPNFTKAHNNLGIALYNQGKIEEGIKEIEVAVTLEPNNTLFRDNLKLYQNQKQGS